MRNHLNREEPKRFIPAAALAVLVALLALGGIGLTAARRRQR